MLTALICQHALIIHMCINTESVRKLSNINFQWTKPLYQKNQNHIAFLFTFFKGYRYTIKIISYL